MLVKGILGNGKLFSKDGSRGNSWAIQWLGLYASTAEGKGLIPGQRTKIPQAVWHGQKTPKKTGPVYLLDGKSCSFASILEGEREG